LSDPIAIIIYTPSRCSWSRVVVFHRFLLSASKYLSLLHWNRLGTRCKPCFQKI
jgi:hypothetical protein